jgi:hypothetical protein
MKQEFTNPRRVVVLVEEADGKQDGWDVFEVASARWEWAGMDRNGARATITVTGSFHRISRSPEDFSELVEPPREIGEAR